MKLIDPLIRAARERTDHRCRVDGEMYADDYDRLRRTQLRELSPDRTIRIRYDWLRVACLVVLMAVSVTALATSEAEPTTAAPIETVRYGDQHLAVAAVQQYLADNGYSIVVDGIYGPQTYRAVTHFQRANGLIVDGIVGPQTQRAMGFVGDAPPVGPSPNAPSTAGLRCPGWAPLLEAHGMPVAYFDYVIYRESRCNPAAYNGRGADDSYGGLQINTEGALWGELQRRCGLTSKQQLLDAATNVACGAQLYRAYGRRPWGG